MGCRLRHFFGIIVSGSSLFGHFEFQIIFQILKNMMPTSSSQRGGRGVSTFYGSSFPPSTETTTPDWKVQQTLYHGIPPVYQNMLHPLVFSNTLNRYTSSSPDYVPSQGHGINQILRTSEGRHSQVKMNIASQYSAPSPRYCTGTSAVEELLFIPKQEQYYVSSVDSLPQDPVRDQDIHHYPHLQGSPVVVGFVPASHEANHAVSDKPFHDLLSDSWPNDTRPRLQANCQQSN